MKIDKKPKRVVDSRINASIISFRTYLLVFIFFLIIMAGQAFILINYYEESSNLVVALVYYFLITALLVTILFGLGKRYIFGRPIARIAEAAREIAGGNFDIKLELSRKDDKRDEIDVLIEDFNKMAEQLRSVETLKSDFIANVSHEFKSPLAIIQNYVTVLKDKTISEKERDNCIDTIVEATKNLSIMVSNILKLNKLENQEIKPVPKPYQLGEQLRRCSLSQTDLWQAKNINFNIDVEDIIVNYDEDLLDIVWNNLISNAIKFTNPGGNIDFVTTSDHEYILVTIKDSGQGMSEDVARHVFDKFYQGDPARATQGNGLGLALVKKVLQIVKADISVESTEGSGSSFTVKLHK